MAEDMNNIINVATEKTLHLIQIQYLDEQLERCQSKCGELEKLNQELSGQYAALEKDKKNSTEQLKRSVLAKDMKVVDLSEKLQGQLQADERDREALELQQSREMEEVQQRLRDLHTESKKQAVQYEEQQQRLLQLKEQRQLMQDLSDMESMKEQLAIQAEEHEAAIVTLKEEAGMVWKRTAEELQVTLDKGVTEKTSKILRTDRAQHEERLEQLQFLCSESEALLKEKQMLRNRERDLCVERDALTRELHKVSMESFTCKKEKEYWTKECQQLQGKLNDWNITNQTILDKEKDLRKQLASVSEQYNQKSAEAVQLDGELQKERGRRKQLERVTLEAVLILQHILTDPKQVWKMHRLLEVLESIAPYTPDTTEKRHKAVRKPCSQQTSRCDEPSNPHSRPSTSSDRRTISCPP